MSIHSRSQSSNSTTLAASTRASPSSAVPLRAISLNLPKKLIKEKSARSKCKAFVKGAQAASPPTVESNDIDENDIDESDALLSDDDDSMEEDSEEDDDENDPNIDPRLLGQTKVTLVSNRKSKSSGSSSINAPLGKLPTKHQSSTKRAKWQLEAEIAQLRADVSQISAAMTQIADHISVRPSCACNDPSTTSSSSDSLYASVMAPSQLIVANSAAEYSSKAKIDVSPDVMFTIEEARQYIAQKAGKTIDTLHPSTVIPPELCTRTADGKDASTLRQNQIRKTLREVCVVIETLPDKREEEDGMIKTRGIQYFRDNYRTIFDRLVDKLEVAIPELQLCADHWKAIQLISRRLKSLSEKDTRRNKLIEKQKQKVKKEMQADSLAQEAELSTGEGKETDQPPDGERAVTVHLKGKGKMATTLGTKSKGKKAAAVIEPTSTSTIDTLGESRPRPVPKQRQRRIKVAEVATLQGKLLADVDGDPSSTHTTSPLFTDADKSRQTNSGLTPDLGGVQLSSSAPYGFPPRFPLPRSSSPSPVSSRPAHAQLPPLRPLLDTMKMPPRAADYTRQNIPASQQDYDYRQGQGQSSRPYNSYHQGPSNERGHTQGYDNPAYGTNPYSTNHYGANPYGANPYGLSPPPTHHSTQA